MYVEHKSRVEYKGENERVKGSKRLAKEGKAFLFSPFRKKGGFFLNFKVLSSEQTNNC